MSTSSTAGVPTVAPVAGAPNTGGAPADPSKSTEVVAQTGPAAPSPVPAPASAAPESQLKLVVAKAAASLAYTYTLVDQVTGRVVAEIPQHAAQDAAASPDYAAGGVVDTRA